jgi:hypothetical protein
MIKRKVQGVGFILVLILIVCQRSIVLAQSTEDAEWRSTARWDQVDETSTADIHKFTTDPKYITPIVSYIPDHETVPSPRDVLGHIVGADDYLTNVEEEYRYFDALAAASPRVTIQELGLTEEGRRMILVIIADEKTLSDLDRYKGFTLSLSDSRKTDKIEAQRIAREAKPIMTINAGIHSPETGPPEMVMELAYRLAVSEHPDIKEIRDNVITMIIPVTEPDGRARTIDWYYRYLEGYDNRNYMPERSPPYWGVHAYHDNNRDGIQMTLKLSQYYANMFHEWHPQYVLDLHESVPLLYVSVGTGPYNEMVDPIAVTEWQWIANWEITELNKAGLPGVWTWGFYTGWNPGYLMWTAINHNSLGRFYETFGNMVPKRMERDLSTGKYAGKPVTSTQWYRSNPPAKKVIWSLRNNTNYMQSGVLASLSLVARNGRTLLENFWQKGYNSRQKGLSEAPYAWIMRADQAGKDRLAYLINQLQRHKIEVHRATKQIEVEEGIFKEGDFVVRLDQPYGNFARNLLRITKFPKEAEHRPYDDVSWTLGKVYRVDTIEIKDKKILDVNDLALIKGPVTLSGRMLGKGNKGFAIRHNGANTLISVRYALKDFKVMAAEEAFESSDRNFPTGSLLIPMQNGVKAHLDMLSKDMMVDVYALEEMPGVSTHEMDLPRLALYHNWVSTQPDGWVRYTFNEAGVAYDYINDDDIKAGNLRDRYDMIIIAHQGGQGNLKAMIHGRDPKFGIRPYTKTDRYASHGVIDSTPDITGGFGFQGLTNLESFLNADGTLLLLGSAGTLATDSGLLRNIGKLAGSAVNTPGSAVQTMVVRRDHPITYGFDDIHHVFRTNGPVYTVPKHFEHWIVVQYGIKPPEEDKEKKDFLEFEKPEPEGDFLITGFVFGQKALERKGVVLDVPRHKGGRVILYSFNPLHRHLNHGDHNYVYNAILNWNDFPKPTPEKNPALAVD